MSERERLRALHPKANFVVCLPDGTEVPCRTPTIGEYLASIFEFNQLEEETENKLFLQCVTDPWMREEIASLSAGVISSVVAAIRVVACPPSIEEFNAVLDQTRVRMYNSSLDQLIVKILVAFPGYTPDDLYAMDFPTFAARLILAEQKLLATGIIKEPITIQDPNRQPEQPQRKKRMEPQKMKEVFEEQQRPSPPPPADGETTVIGAGDTLFGTADDTDKMLRETLPLYKEYVEKQKKHGKISPEDFKNLDERVSKAKEKSIQNEAIWKKHVSSKQQQEKKTNQEIDRKFQRGLKRKRKK